MQKVVDGFELLVRAYQANCNNEREAGEGKNPVSPYGRGKVPGLGKQRASGRGRQLGWSLGYHNAPGLTSLGYAILLTVVLGLRHSSRIEFAGAST